MNLEEFQSEIKKLGLEFTEKQYQQLEKFYQLLIEWNEKINLTRIINKEEIYLKHFYDSLTLVKAIDLSKIEKLCDVGTGAGFPGIVLKIAFPNLEITLVDSLQKRINYLNSVIQELKLTKITAVHSRGEDYAKIHREEFDVVTARAVARLRIIDEICIPLVKIGGYFIPMKANVDEELEEQESTLNKLGAIVEEKIEFLLPKENSTRTLIKIRKNTQTSINFPRSMDKIKKRAL